MSSRAVQGWATTPHQWRDAVVVISGDLPAWDRYVQRVLGASQRGRAGSVFAFTDNFGDAATLSGGASATACTSSWTSNGLVVDASLATTTTSITAAGIPVLSRTAAPGRHLNNTFGAAYSPSIKTPLTLTNTRPGPGTSTASHVSGKAVGIAGRATEIRRARSSGGRARFRPSGGVSLIARHVARSRSGKSARAGVPRPTPLFADE